MEAKLSLYVGSPENDAQGTYLYLGLNIPGVADLEFQESDRLNDRDDEDVLTEFRRILNSASLARKALKLPCHIDLEEIKVMCVELDMSDNLMKEIKNLIKEFYQESKGEN